METRWKDGYMTRVSISREIRERISSEHGLNRSDILVNFETAWRKVKYPTGLVAKHAYVVVRAADYKPTRFSLSQERNERWSMNAIGYVRL
ncbi:MAG: hypothetical protein GY832_11705 [Chloroflexi bacterium]|nr:hypothetical protein [Chloroflexota bacterium]